MEMKNVAPKGRDAKPVIRSIRALVSISLLAISCCTVMGAHGVVQAAVGTGAAVEAEAAKQVKAPNKPKVGDAGATAAYSWWLFAQTVRPSGNAQKPLNFENWQEQCDLQPALCASSTSAANKSTGDKATLRHAHGSALGRTRLKTDRNESTIACGSMNTQGFKTAPATNVAPNAVFCEEVFVNQAESVFILNNRLTTIPAQLAYGNVTFPAQSVEVKVDWIPQSSLIKPFSCDDPSLYIETIEFEGMPKQCYAMVGMHISSKALPDWVWATFEPNNLLTNPNRCNPQLYGMCTDPWGTTSSKPYGPGKTPAQSPALAALMKEFNLPSAFNNYFLTGSQTQFVANNKPIELGNSFVEFNATVAPHQASCITCHAYAYAGISPQNIGGPLPGWPSIGYACNQPGATQNCLPTSNGSQKLTTEDFSWLLGIMPQAPAGTGGAKPR